MIIIVKFKIISELILSKTESGIIGQIHDENIGVV